MMVRKAAIEVPQQAVGEFCRRWKVTELALFGSVLREDFAPESDVDVLISFDTDAHWGLLDVCKMEEELAVIFGRPVDLVSRRSVEQSANWIRREAILGSAEVVYVT